MALPLGIVGTLLLSTLVTAQTPGLRLFQPMRAHATQMVDDLGVVVHSWPGTNGLSAHFEADGTLVRSVQVSTLMLGGATGRLQRMTFDGTVLWDFVLDGPFEYLHHDVEPMPNGNVLVIAWDRYTSLDAIANGRDPAQLNHPDWLPDAILEIQPTGPTTGAVVWEWHVMDHVIQDFSPLRANFGDVAAHPELLDINFPPGPAFFGDWNHFNGLDYDPVNDWIVVSARMHSEIYIIDHSTTTAEASGHAGGRHGKGGDFLWRWGNPQAYRAGTVADQQLFHQHDPRFVAPGHPGAGHVTVFNNDYLPTQSAVFELELPIDAGGHLVFDTLTGRFGPPSPSWLFTDSNFHSIFISSAERLANGNTLICSGAQWSLFEITPAGQMVWYYTYPTPTGIFQADHVDRSLWQNARAMPVAGGRVDFDRLLGSGHAGDFYLLLGSVSGTLPGTPLPGGVVLPLNADFLTGAMAATFNQGVFVETIGTLDASGGARSSLLVPPGFIPPGLAGVAMDFADLVFDATGLAVGSTNPVRVTITP